HAEFLHQSLNLARSEAVKRGLRVNLCKTVDRSRCADTGGWESGWIMFVDANKSGEIEAAEDVLHVEGPPGNRITVRANQPLADRQAQTYHRSVLTGSSPCTSICTAAPRRAAPRRATGLR